ncbi:MAG: serine hydrolase [Deltaproteobacteria bacterium]|nr:serine hydrolase [Deltaproteobacteria bacterium]
MKADIAAFDRYLVGLNSRNVTPGMAVAVVDSNGTVYRRCFGVKKTGGTDPIDPDTVFQIGSASKPLTSTVIASLVDKGVLGWDDKAVEYYTTFELYETWAGQHLTFRDMLCHRSGLQSHAGGELMVPFNYNSSEILYRIRFLEPATDFRTAFEYQNVMFLLAGESAARATGTEWPDLIEREVFDPLGMPSSSARYDDFVTARNRAWNHIEENGTFVVVEPLNYDALSPAGGVSSSIRDMAKWLQFQVNNGAIGGKEIISPEILAETKSLQIVSASADTYVSGYGLGWYYSFLEDGTILDHGGSTTSSTSYLMILPGEKVGVVVLCNKGISHSLPMAVCYTFRDLYLYGKCSIDYYAAFRQVIDPAFEEIQPVEQLAPPPSNQTGPLRLEEYTGTYHSDYYGEVRVVLEDEELQLFTGRNPVPFNLSHWNRNTFSEESYNTAVNFTVRDGPPLAVCIAMVDFNGRNGTFERV